MMMCRRSKLVVIAALTAFLSSCASVETRRTYFRQDRDRCVGREFGEKASWWCGWDGVIAIRHVDDETDQYEIEARGLKHCRWAYQVDRQTGVVKGWHYLSEPENCYIPIDWLGAW